MFFFVALKEWTVWKTIHVTVDGHIIADGSFAIADDYSERNWEEHLYNKFVIINKKERPVKDKYNIWLRYIDCGTQDIPKPSVINDFQLGPQWRPRMVCGTYQFKKNWGSGFIIPNICKKVLSFVESSAFVKTSTISSWVWTKMSSMLPFRMWSLMKWYRSSICLVLECWIGLWEIAIALLESQ